MSKRERMLVLVLMVLAIVLGGYKFLLEGQINTLTAQQAKVSELQGQVGSNGNEQGYKDTLESAIGQMLPQAEEATAGFFSQLDSMTIQQFFIQILNKTGDTAQSLSMTSTVAAAIQTTTQQSISLTYPMQEWAYALSGKAIAPEQTAAPGTDQSAVAMVTVSLQLNSAANLGSILNNIKASEKTVRVSSVTVTADEQTTTVTIVVECFGIERISMP